MKKCILPLSLLLLSAACFTACSETDEPSVVTTADWQKQNDAYLDSLKSLLPNGNIVSTQAQANKIPVGELFALIDPFSSTTNNTVYIFCKKISADNPEGVSPVYTSAIRAYYYGTTIDGASFDGNFTGYGALDNGALSATDASKAPTADDVASDFTVNTTITGWQWVLPFMRTGERWMLYLSYYSGYGSSGSQQLIGTDTSGQYIYKTVVKGYSALAFDVQLISVLY
jgi:FKBP-type peptidyl-prolyl cis-trans isomerase FklB